MPGGTYGNFNHGLKGKYVISDEICILCGVNYEDK